MQHTEITAVFFDWDFTLAFTVGDVSTSERLATLFRSEGVDFTPEELQMALERHQEEMKQGKVRRKPQTRRDIINFYKRLLLHLGHTDRSWELGNRLYDAYGTLPTVLYEDAIPTLQSLQQKGLSLGIISNHSISAREVMEQLVSNFIPSQHIIISEETGVHKPAKTIFQRASRRIGAPPTNCVLVGDSLTVDAIGAVEQGNFGLGLWLDRQGDVANYRSLPNRVARITSLYQVLDFV
jgi:FMN phosphatase YigB (HAD superfamily)